MKLLTLAMIIASSACAPHLYVKRYSDRTVIKAWPPELVDQFCSSEAGTWDDGKPKPKGTHVGGCTEPLPTIWIKQDSAQGHEERHSDCYAHSKNKHCGEQPTVEGYDR